VAVLEVCALSGSGVAELRGVIAAGLGRYSGGEAWLVEELAQVSASLRAARALVDSGDRLASPEVLCAELRGAWERFEGVERGPLVEEVLGRIYSQFCFGK
jgi:tRNA U34 5-carboxymethylaminomethyl modifying GTPase MnmE/TrmE